jgi:uncharacterized protein YjbJ (UPF0337 family)
MNWDQIATHWHQFRNKIQQRWNRLTDNDLAIISGQRNMMTSLLRKKYDLPPEQANREVEIFTRSLA